MTMWPSFCRAIRVFPEGALASFYWLVRLLRYSSKLKLGRLTPLSVGRAGNASNGSPPIQVLVARLLRNAMLCRYCGTIFQYRRISESSVTSKLKYVRLS